jgi:hypothetical protein
MMDLNRHKEIRKRLAALAGEKEAGRIWNRAGKILKETEERYRDLPKGQRFHAGYIFPAAAIQLASKEILKDPLPGYRAISEVSWEKSRKMGASLGKMAKIPGFLPFFVKIWDPVSRKAFGEAAGFRNVFYPRKKGEYRMDIVQCPYRRYFEELGTPELTKIFCINDEYTYGHIPGLEFIRHTTLGTGGEKCDFCIRLKKKGRQ